ncbi:MAG: homocysteine S-methyltransferase family protein [Thermodesulfobacteriota bacterium]
MNLKTILERHRLVLAEAAIIESLRRSEEVDLHPRLENSLLIYQDLGRRRLSDLYRGYIDIALNAGVPILLCAPTWRANRERLAEAGVDADVNGDAVRFLKRLRDELGDRGRKVGIGGLVGCKNDSYSPAESLPTDAAHAFHAWQIEQLAAAEPDYLLAATLPAADEALGIARAMAETGLPYLVSFVIDREGKILDGNTLERAFGRIDDHCGRPPAGYMVNCSYPSFLQAHRQPASVLNRLIGFQGNASALDHSDLDGSGALQAETVSDWGERMVELNRRYGIRVLGGCCGTTGKHLAYIVTHLK